MITSINQRHTEGRISWRPHRDVVSTRTLEVGSIVVAGDALDRLLERFAANVDTSGGPDACWPWTGGRNALGYGRIHVGGSRGRRLFAHRLAYEIAVGPLAANACHRCDNPPCCNPAHIFDGSQRDNILDAASKGRIASGDDHGLRKHPEARERGERHHNARLTEQQVVEIRIAADTRQDYNDIGRRYGVTRVTVNEIALGRKWKHVGGPRTRLRRRTA